MKIIDKLKGSKGIQYIFLGVLSVAVILIFSLTFFKTDKSSTETDTVNVYVSDLEQRLSQTLSRVNGAGSVSVVVTVESGMKTVLATEKTSVTENGKTTVTEKPILVNGKPVILAEEYPEITGVLIVAQGAGSISVMKSLQQATVSLLNIELSQIEILTMK